MDFQQIRDFVNPQIAQATGLQPVDDLQMPVPVAHIVQGITIDGQLSDTSTNPVQNKVVKAAIDDITVQFEGGIEEAVDNWLDNNPDATTTVQDGAITYAKLDNNLKAKADEVTELKNALKEYDTGIQTINEFDGTSLFANLFNKTTANLKKDVNSTTGELTSGASTLFTSDFIYLEEPTKRVQGYNTNRYVYCYDENKGYLGYVVLGVDLNGILTNTWEDTRYIRIQGPIADLDTIYFMYYENRSASYVPYNPVEGNIRLSRWLENRFSLVRERLRFGYLYNKAYIDIDTTASPVTYTLKGGAYILADDGYAKNTGLSVNTPYTLTGFNINYCTIVYSISNNDFRCLQDYSGSFSDYVIFGFYDHGCIYGNLGVVLVNGAVASLEIEKALNDIEIGDLTALQEQVDENTTAIGTNSSAIASEATTRAAADLALGARIDNLVAPSGESVAEITDARVGYNGTIYASLEARLNAEAGRVRNVLVVGVDGQYQTISSAVSAAQNGDIIFVKRGVYEEHVVNRDKILHIVGESKDEVIWKHDNTNYGSCDCYQCGMGSIRNLTMWNYDNGGTPSTQYGRSYCVHLDDQAYYAEHPPISNYFLCENVRFVNDSNECLGLGLRSGMTMEFINCDVETLEGNEAAFYVHAASATGAKCIINGCKIRNNSNNGQGTPVQGALRVEGYNHTDKGCTLIVERTIAVNLGTGPSVVWQLNKANQNSWRDIPDWELDKCSLLNTDGLNYTAQ